MLYIFLTRQWFKHTKWYGSFRQIISIDYQKMFQAFKNSWEKFAIIIPSTLFPLSSPIFYTPSHSLILRALSLLLYVAAVLRFVLLTLTFDLPASASFLYFSVCIIYTNIHNLFSFYLFYLSRFYENVFAPGLFFPFQAATLLLCLCCYICF